ncbi:transposase [Streptomyces sp. NPDC058293]|uniref:helix-turn-helix domain-containing protein n=1 Tax=Streptomyces sp. NPDC058293 TaxID=3346429 RepID=UPI0036E0D0D5
MPVAPARPIVLTASERHRLKKAAWGHKTPYQVRMRAQVVLHAARGRSNARTARETGLHVDTVRRWRGRFAAQGMSALADRERSGRPPSFSALQAAQLKALACQLPAETGVPLSRWSCPDLAREAVERGIAAFLSASTVRRWLKDDGSSPGSTAPGSSSPTPASAPGPPASWTCTPTPGRANRSATTST